MSPASTPTRGGLCYRDPDAREHSLPYDRLLLSAGSVNKLLPIPGVADNAHGFRGLPEALYLRDHLIRQVELAATAADPRERDARLTFVAVGAGYTGTEVTAQGQLLTARPARRRPAPSLPTRVRGRHRRTGSRPVCGARRGA